VDSLIESALAATKSLGAQITDSVTLKKSSELEAAESEVLHYEMKADMKRISGQPRSKRSCSNAPGNH